MFIPTGNYIFKVVDSRINEMSRGKNAGKEYICLVLEIIGGEYNGEICYIPIVPWHNFNWMHNVKSIFSEWEINQFALENPKDSFYAVSSLAFERIVKGKVMDTKAPYPSVLLNGKYDVTESYKV